MSGVVRSTVSGTPISLLRLPSVQTVSPAAASTWARKSLVPVLPCEPVSASTVGRSAVDDVPRQPAERPDRVVDDDRRYAGRPGAEDGGRTGRHRRRREVVPVDVLTRHRDEEAALLDGAAVDERRRRSPSPPPRRR